MYKLILVLVITVAGISAAYFITTDKKEQLPVLNPNELNPEVVDESVRNIGYGHTIGNFSMTNQYGKEITESEIKGKVHVAEYFFTHCGSICPKMNKQMQRVHRKFKSNDDVKILSFTVDPENDTVQRMKWYADKHGASGNNWHFLTGEKEDLYQLARKSYFTLKPAEARNLGDAGSDFIHTNNFVLVDRELRIRGYYDGTNQAQVTKMMRDMELLLEED
ncbi:MAG: SCO family protein [Fluviicola sp. XM-24bin1]|nr:MAG: SCO family protein [Fluviicola sp. XM-24bin1]